MDQHDPFAFIIDLCYISPSQEELLRRCPFVGEPDQPCSAADPVASDGILMMSLPETQVAGRDATGSGPQDQDVFHTPPEKSSIPTSPDTPLDPCNVNREIDVDDRTAEFVDLRGDSEGTVCVDLGRDSDLGFSEVQVIEEDGSSRGIKRDAGGDKSEGELASQDGSGELPMKRLKLSDPMGIEPQKVEEGKGKRGFGTESVGADLQPQNIVQQQGSWDNGIARMDNAAGEGGEQEEKNKNKICVFDVLKLLSDDEDGLENVSLLEAFKSRGLTFPRPRWWPDNDNYRKQRIA